MFRKIALYRSFLTRPKDITVCRLLVCANAHVADMTARPWSLYEACSTDSTLMVLENTVAYSRALVLGVYGMYKIRNGRSSTSFKLKFGTVAGAVDPL